MSVTQAMTNAAKETLALLVGIDPKGMCSDSKLLEWVCGAASFVTAFHALVQANTDQKTVMVEKILIFASSGASHRECGSFIPMSAI